MTSCMLRMPGRVYAGANALENLAAYASEGFTRALLFSDKGVAAAGLLDYPLEILRKAGLSASVYDAIPAEPDCGAAQAAIDAFRESGADLLVAVGGGSVMDLAKLASIAGDKSPRDLLENPEAGRKTVQTAMIPTTAGTGAEATPNAIVAVPEKQLKMGIVNAAMIPDAVFLDSLMTKNLPMPIAASTGLDALCHAIECYTSNKANALSDLFALEALRLIFPNIVSACRNSEAAEAKDALLLAAFYGGVAIGASGTTAVHALSYPLGGKYHIPHGVANALLLLPVMRFNEAACRAEFARVFDALGMEGAREDAEKSAALLTRMEEIVGALDIPADLSAYGVTAEDLPALVKAGMEVERLLVNNKRKVTREDAGAIYRQVLG